MYGSDERPVSLLPPEPSVRYVLGHRKKRGMSQKDPRGRVKVYRDKHRCWADARVEFGKKITDFDVFGMTQESWEKFRDETPHVEVDPPPDDKEPVCSTSPASGSSPPS